MLFLLPLLTASATAAFVPRRVPLQKQACGFSLKAIGSPSGTIKEDTIGENRIGGSFAQGSYSLTNNALSDSLNHNCGISLTSYQFQCTAGSFSSTNFTLADGKLLHDGRENWLACPAAGPGNDGSWNIFSDLKASSLGCEAVSLQSGGSCVSVSKPASAAKAALSTVAAINTTAPISAPGANANATCPKNLNGTPFVSPNLIVPTSPNASTTSFGPNTKAYISPLNTTLYNFAIPITAPLLGSAAFSATCALLFLFPFGSDLDPAAGKFYFSGIEQELGQHGGLDFALLSGPAANGTSFSTTPSVVTDYGKLEVIPGNNYTVGTFPCQSGKTYGVSGGSRGNTELDYFQNVRVQPIGLFVVPCS